MGFLIRINGTSFIKRTYSYQNNCPVTRVRGEAKVWTRRRDAERAAYFLKYHHTKAFEYIGTSFEGSSKKYIERLGENPKIEVEEE